MGSTKRVKKKSIRSAISSYSSSKQKLSRMGKKQKKHLRGLEATYIGRSKCLKLLQLDLKDFRRLCILKGIYPREPHGRRKYPHKKQGQTLYHIKDVRAIAHEPILDKFREFKAFMKKVRRSVGRNELDEAVRKHTRITTTDAYTLHHLVKERYPRFIDALSDLDDALTLVYLFAALPGRIENKNKQGGSRTTAGVDHRGDVGDESFNSNVPSIMTTKAKQLASSWSAYCATTSCITKTFISVKGIYMEAMIRGISIRWIIPHAFTQHIPYDTIDLRVMKTFLEFYETMLNFIMYKLYNDDIGIRYPIRTQDLLLQNSSSTNKDKDNNDSDAQPITTTTSNNAGVIVGSTAALLGANLRALRRALFSSAPSSTNQAGVGAAAGLVSNVVSASMAGADDGDNHHHDHDHDKNKSLKKKNKKKDNKRRDQLAKSVDAALSKLGTNGDDDDDDDDDDDREDGKVDVAGPLQAALQRVAEEEARASDLALPNNNGMDGDIDESTKRKRLLSGLTIFLSREIPRGYLELVCLAYGAKVGWEEDDDVSAAEKDTTNNTSAIIESDPSITHHIVDRPTLPGRYRSLPKNREYVQPQWIVDCANFMYLLPIRRYAVGAKLPPHLSPFAIDGNDEGGYKPAYLEEIERIKNGEMVDDDNNNVNNDVDMLLNGDEAAKGEASTSKGVGSTAEQAEEDSIDMDVDEEAHDEDENEDKSVVSGDHVHNKEDKDDVAEDDENSDDDSDEDVKFSQPKKHEAEVEAHALAKTMMNKKAARLYGRMQHGIAAKKEKVESLKQRRKEIENAVLEKKRKKGDTKSSEEKGTATTKLLKHDKVERLKKERMMIANEYTSTSGTMKKSRRNKRG